MRFGWIAAALVSLPTPALAATWIAPRTTPRLNEIVAIDKTGETAWIYGAEDVAGDGTTFEQPEQSLDLRTAYAAADATRFWARVYVSDPTAVGLTVDVFVFIDADKNVVTGGKTNVATLSPAFTTDVSPGGYEFVVGLRGNGTVSNVWEWRVPTLQYSILNTQPADTVGEMGHDVDPIRIAGDQRGYVQGSIALAVIGLTPACNANLYVRSANQAGPSDLDMAFPTSCVPVDANGDKIPDIVVPPTGCTSNTQCPQGGVCVNGTCVLTPPCVTDANCPANQTCTPDGRCVPKGGTPCTSNGDCNGLVCVNQQCVPCTPGGSECGTNGTCAPNGTCVNGTTTTNPPALGPNERVEGGAFNCGLTRGPTDGVALVIAGGILVVLRSRRRNRK